VEGEEVQRAEHAMWGAPPDFPPSSSTVTHETQGGGM